MYQELNETINHLHTISFIVGAFLIGLSFAGFGFYYVFKMFSKIRNKSHKEYLSKYHKIDGNGFK